VIIERLGLADACVIRAEPVHDDRGSFARLFDRRTFADAGLCTDYPQRSVAYNRKRGIVRGLHFQTAGYVEIKTVRCLRGSVFDVIVDARPNSETFGTWVSRILEEDHLETLYVPAGFAHGYQSLSDRSELEYAISADYVAGAASGIAWDDPDLAIPWPLRDEASLSERDRSLPRLRG